MQNLSKEQAKAQNAAHQLGRALRENREVLGEERSTKLQEVLAPIAPRDTHGSFTVEGMRRLTVALDAVTSLYAVGTKEA